MQKYVTGMWALTIARGQGKDCSATSCMSGVKRSEQKTGEWGLFATSDLVVCYLSQMGYPEQWTHKLSSSAFFLKI